jgi:phospholipid N-methyltransferase
VLRSIDDPRLIVQEGSAEDLSQALAAHGLPAPDAVISGIPFSTMSPRVGRRIIEAVHAALAPGGCFVAYQLRGHVSKLARGIFAAPHVEAEYRNIPPMRVYRWEKRVGLRPSARAAGAPAAP